MLISRARLARPALVALAALCLLAWLPSRAQAAEGAADACPGQELSRPFLPWSDPAYYVLVPDGGVEHAARGWSLSGGAAVVAGNEPYNVGGASDSHSLALPEGASATTPSMCIGIEHPTVRFFARNTGAPASTLAVAVVFRDLDGRLRSLSIGAITGGARWQPTLPLTLTANLLAVLPEGQQAAIRLTADDDGGEWSIDDVYIDPYSKG